MKKYEFTDETIVFSGHTLHRIRALVDLPDVVPGDLGGWVESEDNLSQEGNCWVYENAKVYGDARIYGDAQVLSSALVYGESQVDGEAFIQDQHSILCISNIGYRNETVTFFETRYGTIRVACGWFNGTLDDFQSAVSKAHGDDIHGRTYRMAVELARNHIL